MRRQWKKESDLIRFVELQQQLGYKDQDDLFDFLKREDIPAFEPVDIPRMDSDGTLLICCVPVMDRVEGEFPNEHMRAFYPDEIETFYVDSLRIAKLKSLDNPPIELVCPPCQSKEITGIEENKVRAELRMTPKQFGDLIWNNMLEECFPGKIDYFSYEQYCAEHGVKSKLLEDTQRREEVAQCRCDPIDAFHAPVAPDKMATRPPATNKDYSVRMPEIVQAVLIIKAKWDEAREGSSIRTYGFTEEELEAFCPSLSRASLRAIKETLPGNGIQIWQKRGARPTM
ncbi:hypothetical protein [Desulfocurvus sp. DL9XJH121]